MRQPATVTPEPPQADTSSVEAYHRFAREGSATGDGDDYYLGPKASGEQFPKAQLVIAESLIPTGKPRLAPQPTTPRGPKIAAGMVLVAAAAAGFYLTQHSAAVTPGPVGPPVILDQSAASDSGKLLIDSAATAGRPYTVQVPPGWSAQSQPTKPGGTHTDVTMTEPVLHLTVTVHSSPVAAAVTGPGGPALDVGLRVFGSPATVAALSRSTGSTTQSRVATVTRAGVRYAVTMTVPSASARHDFPRAAAVAAGLSDAP